MPASKSLQLIMGAGGGIYQHSNNARWDKIRSNKSGKRMCFGDLKERGYVHIKENQEKLYGESSIWSQVEEQVGFEHMQMRKGNS